MVPNSDARPAAANGNSAGPHRAQTGYLQLGWTGQKVPVKVPGSRRVLKSRGGAHSSQVREFVLTDHGAELIDVYVRSAAVVTGSARVSRLPVKDVRKEEQDDPAHRWYRLVSLELHRGGARAVGCRLSATRPTR